MVATYSIVWPWGDTINGESENDTRGVYIVDQGHWQRSANRRATESRSQRYGHARYASSVGRRRGSKRCRNAGSGDHKRPLRINRVTSAVLSEAYDPDRDVGLHMLYRGFVADTWNRAWRRVHGAEFTASKVSELVVS